MYKFLVATAASLLLVASTSSAQSGPLQDADAALGVNGLRSLQITAIGIRSEFSQGLWAAYSYLPVRTIKSYKASFDFDSSSLHTESDAVTSPTGGYFVETQHEEENLSDGFAWGKSSQPMGREVDLSKVVDQAQPDALSDRRFWLWSATPQAVLKAAEHAAVRTVTGGTEASYTLEGHHVTAFINQLNQVTRIETLVPNPVLGDTLLMIRYSGYRDFGGIQFPGYISEYEDDQPIIALAVTDVQVNPLLPSIKVPDNVRVAKPPVRTVKLQQLAEGVYWITGSSHNSMVVDMGNYLAMVEAPIDEARSIAVIAEVKKLMPGKPIRYVINTHIHFDHSGGLRTYVAEGATVVTQTNNRAFYEKAWANPRTLEPDSLSMSGKHATFMTIDDSGVIKGSNGRTIELHLLQGNPHNEENLVAWLPSEGILFQSDMMNGGPPAHPTPVTTNFYDNLRRLKIEPIQIIGGHGSRVQTMADLNAAAGKITAQ